MDMGPQRAILFTIGIVFSLTQLQSDEKGRTKRENRREKFNAILEQDKNTAGTHKHTQVKEPNSGPLKIEDLRNLFCPQLFTKSSDRPGAFRFGAANTGDSDVLDYLKSLDQGADYTTSAFNFIRSMQKPIGEEVLRYDNLYKELKKNSDSYKDYGTRKRKHTYATYKKERDKKNEALALNGLKPLMHSQAVKDFAEIRALGFEVDKNLLDRGAHPVINNLLTIKGPGFWNRLRERKKFLEAASRSDPLDIQQLDGSDVLGPGFMASELFLVGGATGFKIAEDTQGNYFVVKNADPNAKYDSLCNSSGDDKEEEEALDPDQLLTRILDAGKIKLSEKECEALRKEMNEAYLNAGGYLAARISSAIDYQGSEAAEILIPKENMSEDLKRTIEQVSPDLKKSQQRVQEMSTGLDSINRIIEDHNAKPKSSNTEPTAVTTFDPSSDSLKEEQFISDLLASTDGQVGPAIEELKKKHPRLIVERPDLAQKFIAAYDEHRQAVKEFEIDKIKAEGLSNKDFVPLALYNDIQTAKNYAQFEIMHPSSEGSPKPTPQSGFTYESHLNPETGNLEIYVCEEHPGEAALLPLKRLMAKPLFTLDKSNVNAANLPPGSIHTSSSYDSDLYLALADKIHCPGDPPEEPPLH